MDDSHPLRDECDEKYEGAILKIYKEVDSSLSEAVELVRRVENILLVSDHGFGPYRYSICVNE